ncbi:MAG: hypothetical protein JWM68_3952 [Verrucomicrobiales bacterium]|nr:hypothetical protein [Verrucomicrobiales bacterium]
MESSVYQNLKERSWQRKLTPQEEAELNAFLAAHPEAEIDWTEETALTECLDQLPDAPVSSNFTAQVLQAIELDEKRISRVQKRGWTAWRAGFKWVFRSAIAGSVACVALLISYQHQLSQRFEMAQNLGHVVSATNSKMEWLPDFEAINRMSRVQSPADEELLAALK